MNTTTTRTLAALATTGALVVGGAAAAHATNGGDDGDTSKRSKVAQLVHEAFEDGVVTVEEEAAIKQAIEDRTDVEFESLDDAVPQG